MREHGKAMRRVMADFAERFPAACWEWPKSRNADGYGVASYKGSARGAHCVAYELTHGPIASGLQIDHVCRNKGCFNPAHLEAVTQSENMRRRWALDVRTHCSHGHEWTAENTRHVARADGRPGTVRWCNECGRIRSREYMRKRNGYKKRRV